MSCKFKVGDLVIGNDKANSSYIFTKKGWIGKVEKLESFTLPWAHNGDCIQVRSIKDPREKYTVEADCFDLYKPHEGKILIMVDEKDPDKIIARDLLTNKTAEAKRNPKDDWDFAKGAKLALERLTEPEKSKYWTGKVVCIGKTPTAIGYWFTVGVIYNVLDGELFADHCEKAPVATGITSLKDIEHKIEDYKFIEYKGGAED